MLRALGATVTVYARRDAVVREAERAGLHARCLTEGQAIPESLVFGTVPSPAKNLHSLAPAKDALVYDLGGGLPSVLHTAEGEEVRTLPLRGAPGVFAPRAAGEIYGGAILDFIHAQEGGEEG